MTTWRNGLAALAALSLLVGMSSGVRAAGVVACGAAATVFKGLKDQNGEIPVFTGVSIAGAEVTITVSPQGSWSMLQTMGSNLCMVAAGDMVKAEGEAAKPDPGGVPFPHPHYSKPPPSSGADASALLEYGLRAISY